MWGITFGGRGNTQVENSNVQFLLSENTIQLFGKILNLLFRLENHLLDDSKLTDERKKMALNTLFVNLDTCKKDLKHDKTLEKTRKELLLGSLESCLDEAVKLKDVFVKSNSSDLTNYKNKVIDFEKELEYLGLDIYKLSQTAA